jgi:hypothetical protein
MPIGVKVGKLFPIGDHAIDTSIESEYNLSHHEKAAEHSRCRMALRSQFQHPRRFPR